MAPKQKTSWMLQVELILFGLTILVSGPDIFATTVPADNFHYTCHDDDSYTRDVAIPTEFHQDSGGCDASARHNVNASDVGVYMQVDAV